MAITSRLVSQFVMRFSGFIGNPICLVTFKKNSFEVIHSFCQDLRWKETF